MPDCRRSDHKCHKRASMHVITTIERAIMHVIPTIERASMHVIPTIERASMHLVRPTIFYSFRAIR